MVDETCFPPSLENRVKFRVTHLIIPSNDLNEMEVTVMVKTYNHEKYILHKEAVERLRDVFFMIVHHNDYVHVSYLVVHRVYCVGNLLLPPNAIVHGNPARIQGYVSELLKPAHAESLTKHEDSPIAVSRVQGVTIHQLPAFEDIRGKLVAAEMAEVLPFVPACFFLVHAVPSIEVRGGTRPSTLRAVSCVR
jgi:hypothetical protein